MKNENTRCIWTILSVLDGRQEEHPGLINLPSNIMTSYSTLRKADIIFQAGLAMLCARLFPVLHKRNKCGYR